MIMEAANTTNFSSNTNIESYKSLKYKAGYCMVFSWYCFSSHYCYNMYICH